MAQRSESCGVLQRLKILALLVGAAVVVTSCGPGLPTMVELKALPESGLHSPSDRFVSHNEHDAERTFDGPLVAIVGDVFATEEDADGVFTFYDGELNKLGYVRDGDDLSNIRTTIEDRVRVWRRGDVVARVAIYRPDDPRVPRIPADLTDGTVYELALIAKAPDVRSSIR